MSRAPRPKLPLFTGNAVTVNELPATKELTLHFAVAKLLRTAVSPGWLWTHFPAGERRDPAVGAKLKRMGLGVGWPDFLLLSPADEYRNVRLHCLELKRRGGRLDPDQEDFAAWCRENRVEHAVVTDVDEAVEVLAKWGSVRVSVPA